MSMNEAYLVIGIGLTFPLGFLYRYCVFNKSAQFKDIFFTLTGFSLYIFCFGWDTVHVIVSTLGSYLIAKVTGISRFSCALIFVLNMSHLLYGYCVKSSINYSVTWTLIHCQATLKVVGYFLDLYDLQSGSTVSTEKNCAKRLGTTDIHQPSAPQGFLTYTAYVYFPFTSLVGPQFQYSRYTSFREILDFPDSLKYSAQRLALGILYTFIFYTLNLYMSADFLISDEFVSFLLPVKLLFIVFWTKWLITKYCAIWLIAESAAALTGIGGKPMVSEAHSGLTWDSISNMDITKFELSLTIQDELSSFNMQTHQWVKRNVYKRCKVLGNPSLSRFISLFFLYIWHGIYIGFFNLFLVEALGISTEQVLGKYISKDKLDHIIPRPVLVVVQYVFKNMCVGYGLCGFALRTAARCHTFYSSLFYCFHWGMFLIILLDACFEYHSVKDESKNKKIN